MATVTLHGPGFSTYTRSARLALEEKGVEYELDRSISLPMECQRSKLPAIPLARYRL